MGLKSIHTIDSEEALQAIADIGYTYLTIYYVSLSVLQSRFDANTVFQIQIPGGFPIPYDEIDQYGYVFWNVLEKAKQAKDEMKHIYVASSGEWYIPILFG